MEQLLNVAACMNLKIYEISLSECFSFPKYICETKMDIFNRSESGSSYLTEQPWLKFELENNLNNSANFCFVRKMTMW